MFFLIAQSCPWISTQLSDAGLSPETCHAVLTEEMNCRALFPLSATPPWAYQWWWSRERLEAGPPASTPVIVSPGRATLLLQQQWQVFKETAVYTRMFYTAKQKIFLPVPPGFRQKRQTLNQQASRAEGKADATGLPVLQNFSIKSWCWCSSTLKNPQRIRVLPVDDVAMGTKMQILPANAAAPWNAHYSVREGGRGVFWKAVVVEKDDQ